MKNKKENEKQNTNETEELSDYVKELLKPENLIGPFDSTEEMLRSMLKD